MVKMNTEKYKMVLVLFMISMILYGVLAINDLLQDRLSQSILAIIICLACYWVILSNKIEHDIRRGL